VEGRGGMDVYIYMSMAARFPLRNMPISAPAKTSAKLELEADFRMALSPVERAPIGGGGVVKSGRLQFGSR